MKDLNHMHGELITFTTADDYELHGFLVRGMIRSNKIIIFVHGMGGNFYNWKSMKKIASVLLSRGYDFFFANNRGHDIVSKSYKKIGRRYNNLLAGTAYEKFEDSWKDIDGAVKEMKRENYGNIILLGHSTGCQKIAYYAYKTDSKNISAIILIGPADDYNLAKKDLGKKFTSAVRTSRALSRNEMSLMPFSITSFKSARRFLSLTDNKRIEGKIFNYEDENMREFSKIKIPIMASFGSREQFKTKPVIKYLTKLKSLTKSKHFASLIIQGADHFFVTGHEEQTAKSVADWLDKVV